MGQLTWQNVAIPSFGDSSTNALSGAFLSKGLGGIGDALEAYQAKREKAVGMENVNRALQYTSSADYQKALESGELIATPETADFFANRSSQLLESELAKQKAALDAQTTASQLETAATGRELTKAQTAGAVAGVDLTKAQTEGQVAATEGTRADTEQQKFATNKATTEFNQAQDKVKNFPGAMKLIAGIKRGALSGNPDAYQAALDAAADPANVQLMVDAGLTKDEILGLTETIVTASGTGEEQKEKFFKADEAQKLRDDTVRGHELANLAIKSPGGTFKAAREFISASKDYTAEEKAKAYEFFDPLAKQIFQEVTGSELIARQALEDGALDRPQAAREVGGEQTLLNLTDQTESGGDYNAIFGQAQREGGDYAGTKVSEMTIGQLNDFANGGYKDYVAGRNGGVKASPFGRYQIVNDTLQSAARELGLSPDTVFSKDVQDTLFRHLAMRRLGGTRGGIQSQMEQLRQEWAGLRNVDDTVLAGAIQDFLSTGGGGAPVRSPLESLTGPTNEPDRETPGLVAETTINDFVQKTRDGTALDSAENTTLQNQIIELDNTVNQNLQEMGMDDIFAGDTKSVMDVMLNPDSASKSRADVVAELNKSLGGDISVDNLTSAVQEFVDKYKVNPAVAAAFMKTAIQESPWLLSEYTQFKDKREINMAEMDGQMSKFFKLDATTPAEQTAGMVAKMNAQKGKATYAANIQAAQKEVQEAFGQYANAANQKLTQDNVDTNKPLRVLQLAQKKLKKYLDAAKADPRNRAQLTAAGLAQP